MRLVIHDDQKGPPGNILINVAAWTGLHVEHRQIAPGVHHCDRQVYTELAYILSGRSGLRRRAEGKLQEGLALPGTSWLAPAGTEETVLEFEGETECLIIHLSPRLLEDSALIDHGIDPARADLVYAGGFADPTLSQIGMAIRGLLGRPNQPVDRLLADGLRTALAAHLIGNYTVDRWQPPSRLPALEPRRLQRVLSYVDARLGEAISLEDLAGEACLSPYHFARLFHQAMGRPPHRYVVERRISAAQERLRTRRASMAEVALDTGFGTQANFSRVFRKVTGLTPRQYRDTQASW
ncbi:MAG: helix-turn-helix transcriptional regulator [Devosia nanyangense]|uniref:Helix-turn-helix transcriptional regulator n=1 Tax=Devosia nanyangense TaxID=1228055 RepID=A0A933L3B0_9HYPH|nr:helix-turn-helix transcriptional regulator [Devosia nanyangense]